MSSSSVTPKNSVENGCAVWDFRINAQDLTWEVLLGDLLKVAKKVSFQLEEGDGGYRHYQGRMSLIKRRRGDQKHIILQLLNHKPNYLAPTVNSVALMGDNFYVLKADTRVEGPWSERDVPPERFMPYQYANVPGNEYPWQKRIRDGINTREPRVINVVYDATGNSGKSSIAAVMDILDDCIDMPPLNDFKDIVALAHDICKDNLNRDPKCLFFDMPRAMGKDKLYGFYSAIEQIKKGKLYDIRYKYSCWWIHAPQVWVFTNLVPDMELMSRDRWRIWTVNQERDLETYNPSILHY